MMRDYGMAYHLERGHAGHFSACPTCIANATRAIKGERVCAGSGKRTRQAFTTRVVCPTCGARVSVTRDKRIRTHV